MEQEHRGNKQPDDNEGQEAQSGAKTIWSVTGSSIAIQIFLIGTFLLWLLIRDVTLDRFEASKLFIESVFSLAIVIVIVVHAIMYYKQAKEANRQVEISTMSLVVSNQAYVGIHSIADRDSDQGGIILVKLENVGRTPADEIRISLFLNGFLLNRTLEQPEVGAEFAHVKTELFGRTKLLPGRLKIEIPVSYAKYVSNKEYELIQSGDMAFYIWGEIVYKDGFGDGKVTEFSFRHSKDGRWLVDAPWSPEVMERLRGKTAGRVYRNREAYRGADTSNPPVPLPPA